MIGAKDIQMTYLKSEDHIGESLKDLSWALDKILETTPVPPHLDSRTELVLKSTQTNKRNETKV